jgi:hypothetical protein
MAGATPTVRLQKQALAALERPKRRIAAAEALLAPEEDEES